MKKIGLFLIPFLFTQIALGVEIQSFSLPWMNNNQQSTEGYNSYDHLCDVFVLENYFLNCGYCNENAANVDRLVDAFTGKRLQVLDVGVDKTDAQYEEWIRRHSPNHPVLKDGSKTLTNQLGTTGYPTTYVIDYRGNVVMQTTGVWTSAMEVKLREKINSLLSEPCATAQ